MTRTGLESSSYIFSYSLQCTSHDFDNNRKTMLTERNQSLLSREVSQPLPYAQKKTARFRRDSMGAARSHYILIVESSLKADFNEGSYSINL